MDDIYAETRPSPFFGKEQKTCLQLLCFKKPETLRHDGRKIGFQLFRRTRVVKFNARGMLPETLLVEKTFPRKDYLPGSGKPVC